MKTALRQIFELSVDELNELRTIVLFDDENNFYETIEEVTDEVLYEIFGQRRFTACMFSCNRNQKTVRKANLEVA